MPVCALRSKRHGQKSPTHAMPPADLNCRQSRMNRTYLPTVEGRRPVPIGLKTRESHKVHRLTGGCRFMNSLIGRNQSPAITPAPQPTRFGLLADYPSSEGQKKITVDTVRAAG